MASGGGPLKSFVDDTTKIALEAAAAAGHVQRHVVVRGLYNCVYAPSHHHSRPKIGVVCEENYLFVTTGGAGWGWCEVHGDDPLCLCIYI